MTETETKLPVQEVVVHPLVLLSVVDHYNRVANKKRVVGVLLGENTQGTIDVTNSYGVPFEDDRKDSSVWYLDHNYHEDMLAMFRKVNAREKVVGWYSTGPKLRPSDLQINDMFRKYCKHPVLVIINVDPTDETKLPTDAYVAVDSPAEERSESEKTFAYIPSVIGATEPEEIGVEHLLRDIRDQTVSDLSTKVEHKANSLRGLQSKVQQLHTYLANVAEGRMPANPKIIYQMQDIFNLLPNLTIDSLIQSFAVKTNDSLLVVYIASLIRSILALHNLINNNIENREREIERRASGKTEKKEAEAQTEKEEDKKSGSKEDVAKDSKK